MGVGTTAGDIGGQARKEPGHIDCTLGVQGGQLVLKGTHLLEPPLLRVINDTFDTVLPWPLLVKGSWPDFGVKSPIAQIETQSVGGR